MTTRTAAAAGLPGYGIKKETTQRSGCHCAEAFTTLRPPNGCTDFIGESTLAKQDELSSTEKLLELIRDEGPPVSQTYPARAPQTAGQGLRTLLSNSLSFTKSAMSVGVDLGHEDLKLVKVNRVSDRKIDLIDYTRVPLAPETPRDHPDFDQFLRAALLKFCGPAKAIELWGSIPSARVETRHLKIPKVSPKQIANTVFWTYQKHSAFNEKETIFDFEVLGDAEEGGVKKIAVMACIAPRKEVEDLRDLFIRAGFPLTGISIVPFAFQTLLRSGRVETHGAAVSSLYIGRDWSRIDIFADANLVLSRGIKAGIRTMVEALQREIEQNWFELSLAKSPTSDQNRIRAIKMRLKQELEIAQNIFFSPIYGTASGEAGEKQLAVKEERIFQMILPALERLVRQMERTIRHFTLNFNNARVEKVYVSSGIQPHPRILDYIGDELGLPIEVLNPFTHADGFRSIPPPPESEPEQSSYAPALGMALASNSITPNFLHTYKDKSKASNTRRINRGVFACFIALILACVGFTFWQEQQINEKDLQKLNLQNQLTSFDVRVDKNLILKLVDQIRARNQSLQGIGDNLIGVAVLGEVANTIPANVRLLSVNARLGTATKPAASGKPGASKKVLILDGVIFGDRATLEADLAAYLLTLKNSPLFRQPTISKKSVETMDNQPVIRFTAQMDVV
jgi:Tfp pilus assembly PilM family ATPase/Tfp pilus assembly protein PilN